MIRGLTVSLLFAVLAFPAYAQDSTPETPSESAPQDNPQTRQTDESEDDYRRSQRRRDTGDIFDDIDINTRSSGSGTILGREVKAIDRLDQESRRHLNKQRAKALAEAQPGEPIDAAYEPSDVAKTDEYVAKQEEQAWKEMMREANSGLAGTQGQGTGSGGGQGDGQGNQSGQGQPGQPGQGQVGQSQDGQSSQTSPSVLRGGSASSASSILDQIKGRSGSSGGRAPQSGQTTGGGQAPQGQAPAGQAPQSGQASQGETSAQGQTQDATLSQTGSDGDAQSASDAKAAADAAAQSQAAADATNTNAAAEAAAHRETISPLERLKRDPVERDDAGGRTSASDYLNRKKD